MRTVAGGVTDFVGDPDAVVMEVVEATAVPFADRIGAVPLPDMCDVVAFAGATTKPLLAVALGAGVGTSVVCDEIVVGAVCAAEYKASFWLTRGAISWTTRLASARRKLVATDWSDEGTAVIHAGKGADVVVM